jgi:predicted Fe-S protein YdhL (DUF1289 family)
MRNIRKELILKEFIEKNEGFVENRTERPLSPCILICTLDDEKQCLGCGRTLEEISSWALMTVQQQWQVIDDLAVRLGENEATIAAESGTD